MNWLIWILIIGGVLGVVTFFGLAALFIYGEVEERKEAEKVLADKQ